MFNLFKVSIGLVALKMSYQTKASKLNYQKGHQHINEYATGCILSKCQANIKAIKPISSITDLERQTL